MLDMVDVRKTPEYQNYIGTAIAYHRAWQSGVPKDIDHCTDWLYLHFDSLVRVCDRYVCLTDQCKRESLIAARQALGLPMP